jgi:hypothetical protein
MPEGAIADLVLRTPVFLFAKKIGGLFCFFHLKDGLTAEHANRCSFRSVNLNHRWEATLDSNRVALYFRGISLTSKARWPSDGHAVSGISKSYHEPRHSRSLRARCGPPKTDGLTLVFGVFDMWLVVGIILRKARERQQHHDRQQCSEHSLGSLSGSHRLHLGPALRTERD